MTVLSRRRKNAVPHPDRSLAPPRCRPVRPGRHIGGSGRTPVAGGPARVGPDPGRRQHGAGGHHTPAELRRQRAVDLAEPGRWLGTAGAVALAAVPGGPVVEPAAVGGHVPGPGAGDRHLAGVLAAACRRRGGQLLLRPLLVVPAGPRLAPRLRGRPRPAGPRRAGIVAGISGGRRPGARAGRAGRLPRGGVRVHDRRGGTTTLVFQLYKWWRPEHNDPHRYGTPGPAGTAGRDPGADAGRGGRGRADAAAAGPPGPPAVLGGPDRRPRRRHGDRADRACGRPAGSGAGAGLPVPGGHHGAQQADRPQPRDHDAARPGASRTSGWGCADAEDLLPPGPAARWSTTGSGRPVPGSCSAACS